MPRCVTGMPNWKKITGRCPGNIGMRKLNCAIRMNSLKSKADL